MDIKALSHEEINKVRHRNERMIYAVCCFINTVLITGLIMGIFVFKYNIISDSRIFSIYFVVISLYVSVFLGMGRMFARTRVNAVRINENQFPELYEAVKKYSVLLDLKRPPMVFIHQEGGVLNAFASYFAGRNYVLINTEIFEIAYLEHRDIDAVSFIIAHEMAHITLHHTKFWYNVSIMIVKLIPFLGPLLSRAQEFSCDFIAKKLCPEGVHGIFMLLLGRHLYKNVNVSEYLTQSEHTRGFFELWLNINASHPLNSRRVIALYKNSGGKLLLY